MAQTFQLVHSNLDRLVEALTEIGYVFDFKSKPETFDWALEIRLGNAIAHAKSHIRKKSNDPLAVFEHPALAWVRNERIVLPKRFRPHPQAQGIGCVDPDTEQELTRLKQQAGGPIPEALKNWFLTCGAVDLRGRHPFLNPEGKLQALHIAPLRQCIDGYEDGWLPLSFGDSASSWKVRVPDSTPDATLADGRSFLNALRNAFEWAGIPGLAEASVNPERELEFIRSKMESF